MNRFLTPSAITYTLSCLMRTVAPALSYTVEGTEGATPAVCLEGGLITVSTNRIGKVSCFAGGKLPHGAHPLLR